MPTGKRARRVPLEWIDGLSTAQVKLVEPCVETVVEFEDRFWADLALDETQYFVKLERRQRIHYKNEDSTRERGLPHGRVKRSPSKGWQQTFANAKVANTKCLNAPVHYSSYVASPPVQRGFILQQRDAKSELERFLEELQYREVTPEDFERLVQLDESVKRPTVEKNTFEKFPTALVGDDGSCPLGDLIEEDCPICFHSMFGESVLKLPCNHIFHSKCIRTWLLEHSNSCPVDRIVHG